MTKQTRKECCIIIAIIVGVVVGCLFYSEDKPKTTSTSTPKTKTEHVPFKHVTSDQVRTAQELIRTYGYTCDSVTEMQPFVLGGGFKVHCNNWRYTYELEDVGGTIKVTVK